MTKRMTKAEAEKIRMYEDRLDLLLFQCMEIAKRPVKRGMSAQADFIDLYPHPIVNRECTQIVKVEYKPYKSYLLPAPLLERLAVLEEDIEKAEKKAKRESKAKAKAKAKLGRQSNHSIETVKEWTELREQGVTLKEIPKQYDTKATVVCYQVKRQVSLAKAEEKAKREAEKALRNGRMVKQMKAESLMHTWAEEYKAGATTKQIATKYNLSD